MSNKSSQWKVDLPKVKIIDNWIAVRSEKQRRELKEGLKNKEYICIGFGARVKVQIS